MHSRVCFLSFSTVFGSCLSLGKLSAESADVEADFAMHLGRSGEAYFVGEDDLVGMTPCLQGSLYCHMQHDCHVGTIILSICMQCPYSNCQACHGGSPSNITSWVSQYARQHVHIVRIVGVISPCMRFRGL